MLRTSAAMVVLLALVGCGGRTIACTTELRMSLVIHVVDAAGRPECGATVIARDAAFSARLRATPAPECTYFGIPERKGTYDVDVRRGAQHAQLDGVKVTADQCHVHTRQVSVTLPS